jgi:3-methyladenine DNA glycosylase Mpg
MINAVFNETPKPFIDEQIRDGVLVRSFQPDQQDEDFVWHRDKESRRIEVIEGCGWLFQYDNELPFLINKGDEFFVPKMVYHRIIPGTTTLRIKIDELVEETTKLAVA